LPSPKVRVAGEGLHALIAAAARRATAAAVHDHGALEADDAAGVEQPLPTGFATLDERRRHRWQTSLAAIGLITPGFSATAYRPTPGILCGIRVWDGPGNGLRR
jgi:hypothetical protein